MYIYKGNIYHTYILNTSCVTQYDWVISSEHALCSSENYSPWKLNILRLHLQYIDREQPQSGYHTTGELTQLASTRYVFRPFPQAALPSRWDSAIDPVKIGGQQGQSMMEHTTF